MADKKGVARQLMDRNGMPMFGVGSMLVGHDNKGVPIYKAVHGSLWDLDGYDTFVPDGYVPAYNHKIDKWRQVKEGSTEDPFRQLGFSKADDIPF